MSRIASLVITLCLSLTFTLPAVAQLPVSTSFAGVDANPISESNVWTSPAGFPGAIKIASHLAVVTANDVHDNARYDGVSFPADQYAKATVNASGGMFSFSGVMTRVQANGSAYVLYYTGTATGTLSLYRLDNPGMSFTLIFSSPLQAVSPGVNVSVEMRSIGSIQYAFYNGNLVGQATDATYATGQTGIAEFISSGQTGSMSYWEAGSAAADGSSPSEYTLGNYTTQPNYTSFTVSGTQNPLSEGNVWLAPTINPGSNADRHWYSAMQKTIGQAYGTNNGEHSVMYHSGTFHDAQFSAAVISTDKYAVPFAGVSTRMVSNGNCYFIFYFGNTSPPTIRLYKYDNSVAADSFIELTEVNYTATGPIVLELDSIDTSHSVYVTPQGGSRTLVLGPYTDATYTSGSPGVLAFGTTIDVYEWWGGNFPTGGCTLSLLGTGC